MALQYPLAAASASSPASCPFTSNTPLSCHNTTVQPDTCCFNAPGGQLLLTQFWDYKSATGPLDSWTLHGNWPDLCDGTFDQYCDASREYSNITQVLQAAGADDTLAYMNTYWKDYRGHDESLWEHEWNKHGTCISTLSPACYASYVPQAEVVDFFTATVALFKTVDAYALLADAGILPSVHATFTFAAVNAALAAGHGGHSVSIQCKGSVLDEIWFHFNVRGSVQTGQFVATDPDGSKSSCPAKGIRYLPKGNSPAPGHSSRATATATASASKTASGPAAPTATGPPFSGRGFLHVNYAGVHDGCIISAGTWYTSGTCATYTATALADGSGAFTLKSHKGDCAIQAGGLFSCGAHVKVASAFTASAADLLLFEGAASFYADAPSKGRVQRNVYADSSHATEISIAWQAVHR